MVIIEKLFLEYQYYSIKKKVFNHNKWFKTKFRSISVTIQISKLFVLLSNET